jgi:hypothetical protein
MASSSQLLVALIGALAVAIPTAASFWHTARRNKRLTPKEEDELVTRTAKEAVETMNQVLDTARQERVGLLRRVADLELRVTVLTRDKLHLEAEVARLQHPAET